MNPLKSIVRFATVCIFMWAALISTVTANFVSLWAWDNPASIWYFYAPSLEALGAAKVKEYTDTKGYLDFATQNRKLNLGTGFWVNR